jgi:class 3 adenylate cyclase
VERVPGGDRGRRVDEMRPITALFADIVGSTALGERLAPDEVKALVGECISRMSRAVEEFGGVIQAYMGDGICAYFGVPAAHEDDPERAARAALRIVAVVGEYAREVEAAWGVTDFNVRVGINSGPAAVGVVGHGDPQAVALGDATNVAARLESSASAGTILIGEATAQRLHAGFQLESAGEISVKGRAKPVAIQRLIEASGALPKRRTSEPPIVGRDEELKLLESIVTDAAAGRGRALLVLGDSGIGKSRMLSELRASCGEEVIWLEGTCSSYGGDTAYGPFVDALRGWLGALDSDAPIATRTRLRARVAAIPGTESLSKGLPLLGWMLGFRINMDGESMLSSQSSDERTVAACEAYVTWIEALASTRPVVLAIDDLHHADGSSLGLAEELLALTDRAAFVLATTLRPGSDSAGWGFRTLALAEYSHRVAEVSLGPLSEESCVALVRELVPAGLLTDDLRSEVVARAEGNPMFLQELVRALIEGGDRRRTWSVGPASTADLPPAVEGLLVARVDRLSDDARTIAQAAAVIGREFSVRVLEAVLATPDVDLTPLLREDVIREIRRFPEFECAFSHGLLHEAVLSTLTPTALRRLSARVGEVLEAQYADALDQYLETLAFLFYRSDDATKALRYLELAADKAAATGDPVREDQLLERAEKAAARAGDREAARRVAERRGPA